MHTFRIVSTEYGEYTHDVVVEFDKLWNAQQSFSFDEIIEEYTTVYTKNKIVRKQEELARQAEIPSLEVYRLQPNSMQVGFINNLRKIYEAGEDKALLISATGFRVIIVTVANSLGNIRVFELLPKLKTKKYGWCIA